MNDIEITWKSEKYGLKSFDNEGLRYLVLGKKIKDSYEPVLKKDQKNLRAYLRGTELERICKAPISFVERR